MSPRSKFTPLWAKAVDAGPEIRTTQALDQENLRRLSRGQRPISQSDHDSLEREWGMPPISQDELRRAINTLSPEQGRALEREIDRRLQSTPMTADEVMDFAMGLIIQMRRGERQQRMNREAMDDINNSLPPVMPNPMRVEGAMPYPWMENPAWHTAQYVAPYMGTHARPQIGPYPSQVTATAGEMAQRQREREERMLQRAEEHMNQLNRPFTFAYDPAAVTEVRNSGSELPSVDPSV